MAEITDFYRGTTKNFTVSVTMDGVAPDISGDVVTLTMKTNKNDADAAAILQETADVATDGANGNAIFELTPAVTNIVVGDYSADVKWELATGEEYILLEQGLRVRERVSDV